MYERNAHQLFQYDNFKLFTYNGDICYSQE